MNLNDGNSENVGRVGHETIGAEYLSSLGFSDTVCRLVKSHVAAKRCVYIGIHRGHKLACFFDRTSC